MFNSQNTEVNDLLSYGRAQITNVKHLAITVQYMDFIVKVNVPGTNVGSGVTVTDLMINQAIKLAVNENPVLKDFLIAQDGPSGTLIVMSKVDGRSTETDFTDQLGRCRRRGSCWIRSRVWLDQQRGIACSWLQPRWLAS